MSPQTLPVLADYFAKAAERTQVIISTHSSYFLTRFPLEDIAVMRKEEDAAVFYKPANSAYLRQSLEEFRAEGVVQNHAGGFLNQAVLLDEIFKILSWRDALSSDGHTKSFFRSNVDTRLQEFLKGFNQLLIGC